MLGATLLFALMGAAVKVASDEFSAGAIVMARSLVGLVLMALVMRWRRIPLASPVPRLHLWRGVTGTVALCLWFTAIGALPLATAMTLNYMSSVWIAVFLLAGSLVLAPEARHAWALDWRLVAAVLAGFVGVVLVLQPTFAEDQWLFGLVGLASGMLAGVAYLQVSALGRLGEPGERVVFYFSLTGVVFGAVYAALDRGMGAPTATGLWLLLAIGVLATAAQWMMTRAYGTGATLGIASLQYLAIVFSSLLGWWLFDETIDRSALFGMVLIIVAGLLATLLRAPAPQAGATPGVG